jgi:hypothetical protein
VSAKVAIKPSTLTANGIDSSSDVLEIEELLQVTDAPTSADTAANNTCGRARLRAVGYVGRCRFGDPRT